MDSDRCPFCWFEHISLRPIYACTYILSFYMCIHVLTPKMFIDTPEYDENWEIHKLSY